jgi:signal peptidase
MADKRWRDDDDYDEPIGSSDRRKRSFDEEYDDWYDDEDEDYTRPSRDGRLKSSDKQIDAEEEEEEVTTAKKIKSAAFNISKDLIIVVGILLVIIVVLVVYTGSWPPVVVIESGSMMHHYNTSEIGALDTGDMVLLKSVEEDEVDKEITTWVEKEDKHYGTWGDVLIFKKNGEEGTPICHRAVVWLEFNDTTYDAKNHSRGAYDIPSKDLYGIDSAFTIRDYPSFSSNKTRTVDLHIDVGRILNIYRMLNMTPDSGFITKGDNNPDIDQPGISQPVQKNWILGKAKGEIPWYGLVNLKAQGNPNTIPSNSYAWFFFSLAIIIATPFALDFGIRAIWRWKKREHAEEAVILTEEYEAQGLRQGGDEWDAMEGDGWDAWDEYEDVEEEDEGPKLRDLSDEYDKDVASSYWEWYYHEGRMRDYDPRRRRDDEEEDYYDREPPPPPPHFMKGGRRRPRYDDEEERYYEEPPPPPPRRRGRGRRRRREIDEDDYDYDRPRRRQPPPPPPPPRRRRSGRKRSMGRQGRTAPPRTSPQRSDRKDHYFYFQDEDEDEYDY